MTFVPLALIAATALAAERDLRVQRVPNWLTATAVISGLAGAYIGDRLSASVAGLIIAVLLYFPLFRLRALGAGDVKLLAAVGAIGGFAFVLFATFYILAFGIAAAIVVLAFKRRLAKAIGWMIHTAGARPPSADADELTVMPFAPVVFAAVAYCVYLETTVGPFSVGW